MVGAALALRQLGHEVEVVTGVDPFLEKDLPVWQGVPVTGLARLGPHDLHYTPRLRAWLTQQAPFDVVVLHGVWISMHAQALGYATEQSVPVVLAPHGMLSSWALERSSWKKALARRVYVDRLLAQASCFWVNSQGEADDVERLGYAAPAALIPHGVDFPSAAPRSDRDQRALRTLMFLGRLHPKKGIEPLLDAWRSLRAEDLGWRLALVGPDELGMVHRLKGRVPHSNVDFVGPLYGAEKLAYVAGADALILPSLSEGLPVTVLEAWAHGLPVIMTDQCNLPAGFAHEAAIRVEANTVSIAEGIKRLIAMTDDQRSVMGSRGRRLVETEYSWASVGQKIEAMLHWLVFGGVRPDCVRARPQES